VGVTRISQVYHIRNSVIYDDTLDMPFGEVLPKDLEDDLNYIRTQLKVITGEENWYDPPVRNLKSELDVGCREDLIFNTVGDWSGQTLTLGFEPLNGGELLRVFWNGQLLTENADFTFIPPDQVDFIAPLVVGDYITALGPCSGGGVTAAHNTLQKAYNEGGPGAGRTIFAENGPVFITSNTSTNNILELHNGDFGGDGYVFVAENDGDIIYNLDGYQRDWRIEHLSPNSEAFGSAGRLIFDDRFMYLDIGNEWVPLNPINIYIDFLPPNPFIGDRSLDSADGLYYTFDGTRWLSDARKDVVFSNDRKVSNQYARLGDTPSNLSGYRIHRDALIKSISIQTNAVDTWVFEIRKNGSASPIVSVPVTASDGATALNVNVELDAGDRLQAYINGTKIEYPTGSVELVYRLS